MKKYFALAAVATMFAACTNEEVIPQVDALTGMPIQVKTNVAKMVDSRVAGMDSEADFNTFYMKMEGETNYEAKMSRESEKWVAYDIDNNSNPLNMVWTNGDAVKISAIMSGTIAWTSDSYNNGTNTVVSVYKDQSGNLYENSDFLYMAPVDVTPDSDGSITINFNHLMSKVRISIATGSSEDSDPVSSVKVGGTHYNRYFVPATGAWQGTFMKAAEITAHADSYKEGTSVYEAILVPQEVSAGTFAVSFTMGEKNYKWTSSEAVTLESGKLYTLALQVPDNDPTGDAVIVSVNVANWPTETVTLGDTTNDVVVVE